MTQTNKKHCLTCQRVPSYIKLTRHDIQEFTPRSQFSTLFPVFFPLDPSESKPVQATRTYLQTVNLHFEHLYFYSTITIIAPYM